MNIHTHFRRNSGAQPPGPRSTRMWAVILLVSFAALVPCSQPAGAERRRPREQQDADQATEGRRWWLETWAHSMQETRFINWMNAQSGGTTWQMVMSTQQVNGIYFWWLMVSAEGPDGK